MRKKDIIIHKSAKRTEVMMAYFLHSKVFPDKVLLVGDEGGKYPDIRTADEELGIEVVQAEQAEDFAANLIWTKFDEYNGDADKLKHYIRKKLSGYEVKLFVNNRKVEAWTTNDLGHSAYYSKRLFFTIINKKLEKLNSGNYNEIKGEIDLAIISVFRSRSDKHARDILSEYQKIKGYYKQNFNKIFVLFTDTFYIIDHEKIDKIKIEEKELKNLRKTIEKIYAKNKN